jgi:integrase
MYNPLSILFYIKRTKVDKTGKSNIYFRVTIDGNRAEASILRKVKLSIWNTSGGLVNGTSPEAYTLNSYIAQVRNDIYTHFQRLTGKGEMVTAVQLRDAYLGKGSIQMMVLKIFQDHNDQVNKLVGLDFAAGTAERYRTTKMHVENYIKKEFNISDIPVQEVNHKFISGLEYYLKTERKCGHNSTIKYITNFKKIIRIAFANEWIKKDPFLNWKGTLKIVDREFLSKEEIQLMMEKDLDNVRLDLVKDIFIFCCYTGLAYADVKKLSENDVVIGIDGNRWIKTNRTKTKVRSSIPILPTAEAIIEKYVEQPDVNIKRLLPVLSNQKMNAYLKEIADVCGIHKNLTFHLARHTFATTVAWSLRNTHLEGSIFLTASMRSLKILSFSWFS